MLTISPPPELEEQLRLEAKRLGVAPEQLLLQTFAEKWAPSTIEADAAEADQAAALDELVGCLVEVPTVTTSWRRYKEDELALEEENFLRDFRGRQTQ